MSTNRLDTLKFMVEQNPQDGFARYGLAMEYVKAGDLDRAIEEFETLLRYNASYAAGYFHEGQTFENWAASRMRRGSIAKASRLLRIPETNTREVSCRRPTVDWGLKSSRQTAVISCLFSQQTTPGDGSDSAQLLRSKLPDHLPERRSTFPMRWHPRPEIQTRCPPRELPQYFSPCLLYRS